MPSVGAGVNEIRVHTKGEHRVMYVAKFNEAAHVLHAFGKKSPTDRAARHRLGESTISGLDRRAQNRAVMSGRVKIELSSGNVFTDLGFPKAEAENLMLRSELMSEIRELAREMTQARAAKRFGITQPRLNDLLRGKIDKFSLDALVNMIAAAGLHVRLQVRKVA